MTGQKMTVPSKKRLRAGGNRTQVANKKARIEPEMHGMRRASYEPRPTMISSIADRVKRRRDRQPPQRLGFM